MEVNVLLIFKFQLILSLKIHTERYCSSYTSEFFTFHQATQQYPAKLLVFLLIGCVNYRKCLRSVEMANTANINSKHTTVQPIMDILFAGSPCLVAVK